MTKGVERYLAAILVFGVGANELLHAIFDGLNFSANVEFVHWVLSMSATNEPDSWRAVSSHAAATVAYALIWLAHVVGGAIAAFGSYLIARAGKNNERGFALGIGGAGISAVLYLIGFLDIAGVWFLLYTAPRPPNYTAEALSLFVAYMAVIIYLALVRRGSDGAA